MKNLTLLLLFAFAYPVHAQDYDNVIFEDVTYVDNIKTVQMVIEGKPFSNAIYNMDVPAERLLLSFDDLNGGFENYVYTIIHCNTDWTPTNLFQNQYLAGFFRGSVLRAAAIV